MSARLKPAQVVLSSLLSLSLLAASACVCAAGDIKAGRAKAQICQACHGLDGLSKTPDAPNIAGQTEPYIVAQLQAFKSGTRKNDAMSVVAPSLHGRRGSCGLFFGNRD
jgi:cytochrome c553